MSRFSGKQGKGAARRAKTDRQIAAYHAALAIWNDGTGRLPEKENRRVAHPYTFIPKRLRPTDEVPTLNSDFPLAHKIFGSS